MLEQPEEIQHDLRFVPVKPKPPLVPVFKVPEMPLAGQFDVFTGNYFAVKNVPGVLLGDFNADNGGSPPLKRADVRPK